MASEVKYFFFGGLSTFLMVFLAALFIGPSVNVQTSVEDNDAGGGRYLLQVNEEAEGIASETVKSFSVIDTQDGLVYVFRPEDAQYKLPTQAPVEGDAADSQ